MDIGFLWGLGALALIGVVFFIWRWERREKARTGAAPTSSQVAIQVESAVAKAVAAIPRTVSEEVQRLEGVVTDLSRRAQKAEADFATEHAASIARTEAVGAAVMKALSDLGEMTAEEAAGLAARLNPELVTLKQEIKMAIQDALAELKAAADADKAKAVAEAVANAVQPAVAAQEATDEQAVRDFAAANYPPGG